MNLRLAGFNGVSVGRVCCVLMLLSVACGSAAAEAKRDILGYSTGMSAAEADSIVPAGKKPLLEFTKELSVQRVNKITLAFESGTRPIEMITIVSREFAAQPVKSDWTAEILHATIPRRENLTTIFGTKLVWVVGGEIAAWQLAADDLTLKLRINRVASHEKPYEYYLILQDEGLARQERAIRAARTDEQRRVIQSIDPHPKF